MLSTEIKRTKEIVREVMSKHSPTRNSYAALIRKAWETNPELKPETITRVCREIQHVDKELLPTDPLIFNMRFAREKDFRRHYSSGQDDFWQDTIYDIR